MGLETRIWNSHIDGTKGVTVHLQIVNLVFFMFGI